MHLYQQFDSEQLKRPAEKNINNLWELHMDSKQNTF